MSGKAHEHCVGMAGLVVVAGLALVVLWFGGAAAIWLASTTSTATGYTVIAGGVPAVERADYARPLAGKVAPIRAQITRF